MDSRILSSVFFLWGKIISARSLLPLPSVRLTFSPASIRNTCARCLELASSRMTISFKCADWAIWKYGAGTLRVGLRLAVVGWQPQSTNTLPSTKTALLHHTPRHSSCCLFGCKASDLLHQALVSSCPVVNLCSRNHHHPIQQIFECAATLST